jgi:hypothetical protein
LALHRDVEISDVEGHLEFRELVNVLAVVDSYSPHAAERSFEASRPARRTFGSAEQRQTERPFGTGATELELDVDGARAVPENGCRRATDIGKAVEVREVEGIAHRGLSRVVLPEKNAKPVWEPAGEGSCCAGSKAVDRNRAQVHIGSSRATTRRGWSRRVGEIGLACACGLFVVM